MSLSNIGAVRVSFLHEDTQSCCGEAQFSFCEIPMNRVGSQVMPIWRIVTDCAYASVNLVVYFFAVRYCLLTRRKPMLLVLVSGRP